MRYLLIILALTLIGCVGDKGRVGENSLYDWYYTEGPNGERCLIATQYQGMAMHCDSVNWPNGSR